MPCRWNKACLQASRVTVPNFWADEHPKCLSELFGGLFYKYSLLCTSTWFNLVFWMAGWTPTGHLTPPQPPKGRKGSSAGRTPRTRGGNVTSWPPGQGRPIQWQEGWCWWSDCPKRKPPPPRWPAFWLPRPGLSIWVSPAQVQCLENSRNARNEVGVGSDMTITFLKNNSGDDMEDRSELGGLHRAWTGAHAVGLEGRDLAGKAQQGPASLCLQGPCSTMPSFRWYSFHSQEKESHSTPVGWLTLQRA